MERYHQRCLRRILNIKWEDRRTDASVLTEAKTTSIEAMIIKHQLRWSGQCVRMSVERLPKKVLYSQLSQGQRTREGQRKHYKDTLKASLQKWSTNTASWENLTADRASWRQLLHRSTASFEMNRLAQATAKRQQRKER